MSHKKRVYPQQQFQLSQPAQQAEPQFVAPPVAGYPQQQQVPVTNGAGTFVSGLQYQQQQPIEQLQQDFQQMNFQQQVQPQQQQQYPGYQQPAAQQQAPVSYGESKPMNQLYPVDLLNEVPPSISDLKLPPPPLVVPVNKFSTPNGVLVGNNCQDYMRSTLNAIPKTNSLLKKSKLPLAVYLHPYNKLNSDDEDVPLVTDGSIDRCRRCRGYINCFVEILADGAKWKCNMCNLTNEFMIKGRSYQEIMNLKQLNYSVVDFIAPKQYSVRAVPPAIYCFVLDCSLNAMQNGLFATTCRTILECLDTLPNRDGRTKVSLLCADSSIHYFKIKEQNGPSVDENGEPIVHPFNVKMFDVGDLDDAYQPTSSGLLVSLTDAKQQFEQLFTKLPEIFATTNNASFALAPALKAAKEIIGKIGGKIIVVSATLPNIGEATLQIRQEKQFVDTKKESSQLLTPQHPFYKSFCVDANKQQITIDIFLASEKYIDVASHSNLTRFTSGQLKFYPGFSASNLADITKFTKEFSKHVNMDLCSEAVIRTRGSHGLKVDSYFGHCFVRASDLAAMSTFPRDQGYVCEISIDENISKEYAYIQCGLLLSNNNAQRRVRTITICIPTTDVIGQVFASVDQLALVKYYASKAISKINLGTSLIETREYLDKQVLDILQVYKQGNSTVTQGSSLKLCANMKMFPLLMQALVKNLAFRQGAVPSDHRSAMINELESSSLKEFMLNVYPDVYSLHDMPDEAGLPDEETGEIVLPDTINASHIMFEKYGLYLIDTGSQLFIWVGGESVAELLTDAFGIMSIDQLPIGKFEMPLMQTSEFNIRVNNIIAKVRENDESCVYKNIYIVKGVSMREPVSNNSQELSSMRTWLHSFLVEDRCGNSPTYREFLSSLNMKVAK
ncbi:hypothetical protein QEN19_000741 [Hanseniaspora menglaensis]